MRRLLRKAFSMDGTDDRRTFLLFSVTYMLLVPSAGAFVNWAKSPGASPSMGSVSPLNWIVTILLLLLLVASLLTTIRRLRDIGVSFWFLILMFVPVLNVLMLLALLLVPGDQHTAFVPPVRRWN